MTKRKKTLDDFWGAGAEAEIRAAADNADVFEKHLDDERAFRSLARFFNYVANEAHDRAIESVNKPARKPRRPRKS